MTPRIYLDYNATTPLAPEAAAAMQPWLGGACGNPSSLHHEGRQARAAIEEARAQVAGAIGAQPREILFVSGGTEANHLALLGATEVVRERGRHVIISAIEHASLHGAADALTRRGFTVSVAPVTAEGIVTPEAVESLLRPDTILVSVMAANNETGVIQPVAALAALAHRHGALFHTDAAQAAGKIPVDVRDPSTRPARSASRDGWPVDFLSLAAHKCYSPLGVGALYVRSSVRVAPLFAGGHQEFALRSGTEPVALIAGFGAAASLAARMLPEEAPRLAALRERLWEGLTARIAGLERNGSAGQTVPNTLNVRADGVDGQLLLMQLDLAGIAVSTGSACSSGSAEPSPVLLAMGRSSARARGAVRFSLGRWTTREEIDAAVETTARLAARLRERAAVPVLV